MSTRVRARAALCALASSVLPLCASGLHAGISIQDAAGTFGNARLIGNSFSSGSAPGGNTPSSTSTQANVTLFGSGGSGSTSGGLGDTAGTVTFGTARTDIGVTANATEFRVHIAGSGDMNAPSGYTNLSISASVSIFSTAIHITGSGAMPFTIQRTGDLASVGWALVPEAGSGASINGNTLTPGDYRFDADADAFEDAPSAFITYNFGNGGGGNVHRTFSGDFALVLGSTTSGVCCRGATCSTSITQANCTPPAGSQAGALFVAASACNAAGAHTPCCYADYTKSGGIAITDIFAYLNDWFASRALTVVGGDGSTGSPSVQDIFNFLNAWFAGC